LALTNAIIFNQQTRVQACTSNSCNWQGSKHVQTRCTAFAGTCMTTNNDTEACSHVNGCSFEAEKLQIHSEAVTESLEVTNKTSEQTFWIGMLTPADPHRAYTGSVTIVLAG
jgi:hypothetical protein